MMVLSALRPDASLFEYLAERARGASARRLAADVVAGAAVVAASVYWNTPFLLACVASCLVAYGAWGLLDRAATIARARTWTRAAAVLEYSRPVVAVAGVLAAIGVLLSVWALALGTWIS